MRLFVLYELPGVAPSALAPQTRLVVDPGRVMRLENVTAVRRQPPAGSRLEAGAVSVLFILNGRVRDASLARVPVPIAIVFRVGKLNVTLAVVVGSARVGRVRMLVFGVPVRGPGFGARRSVVGRALQPFAPAAAAHPRPVRALATGTKGPARLGASLVEGLRLVQAELPPVLDHLDYLKIETFHFYLRLCREREPIDPIDRLYLGSTLRIINRADRRGGEEAERAGEGERRSPVT